MISTSTHKLWDSRNPAIARADTFCDRGPAFAFIQKCLSLQNGSGPRGALEKFFGLSPLLPEARAWYQDALGEIEVATSLAGLGDDWSVLHTIPGGQYGRDIDHLVIGPAGVFTIMTKAHSGQRIYVGGHIFQVGASRKRYLAEAEHAAARVSQRLSAVVGEQVPVTPLIVVTAAVSLSLADGASVEVLSPSHLGQSLRRRRRVLTDDAIARVTIAADRPSLWQAASEVVTEPRVDVRAFAVLRREVDAASARARLWASAGTVSLLLGLTAFVVKVLPALMTQGLVH